MKLTRIESHVRAVSLAPVKTLCIDHSNNESMRVEGRTRQTRNRRILAARPLCSSCELVGRVRAATEVDHIVPLFMGGTEAESNLQGLCHDCHAEKTARESVDRSRGVALAAPAK